jgi:hypothetical protein
MKPRRKAHIPPCCANCAWSYNEFGDLACECLDQVETSDYAHLDDPTPEDIYPEEADVVQVAFDDVCDHYERRGEHGREYTSEELARFRARIIGELKHV